MNLYYRAGTAPAELPFGDYDEDGRLWTDLANNPEGVEACGLILAPPRPNETAEQSVEWDAEAEDWIMVDRPPTPPPSAEDMARRVDAEHDRRTLLGRAFPVDGVGDVPLEGSERTQLVLLALKDTARDLRDADVTAPLLMLTDRDGTDRWMNATQMIALVNAGKAWMQQVHEAKRALKAMDPIPVDFADDRHWPPLV